MQRASAFLTILLATFAFADVGYAQQFLQDGFGRCLHIPEESWKNGIQLRTWTCSNRSHLRWEKAVPFRVANMLGGKTDYFWLKNVMTGKCAAVHAGQKHDGAWVVQWDCRDEKNFDWSWRTDGQLQHRESGKCLHVASGAQYSKVTIRRCAGEIPRDRLWNMSQASGPANMPAPLDVFLKNGYGKCLRAQSGTLSMSDCSSTQDKIWRRMLAIPSTHVWFSNFSTKQCAAIQAGQKHDGAPVILAECGSAPQAARFHWMMKDGQLVHRESGKCLAGEATRVAITECGQKTVPNNLKWAMR